MSEASDPNEPNVSFGDIAASTDPNEVQTQITDGSLQPTTLKQAFRMSLDKAYPNLKLTSEGAARVRTFVTNMRAGGSAGVVMICAGDNCEFKSACPLYKEKAAPVGEPCPLEATIIRDTRQELATLADLDTRNPIIRSYINELTSIAVIIWRCQMKMAYDYHDVMQQVPACVTPEGTVHTKPEASPILETLNQLSNRRSRLLKELAMTPEAKWRKEAAVGDKSGDSLSRSMAAKKAALQNAQKGILTTVIAPPAHVQLPGAVKPIQSDDEPDGDES